MCIRVLIVPSGIETAMPLLDYAISGVLIVPSGIETSLRTRCYRETISINCT